MIFASLALLIPAIWIFPWWALPVFSAFAGFFVEGKTSRAVQFSICAGVVACAFAFIKDGQNGGVISRRVSAMFALPGAGFAYLVLFFLCFVTAFLWFRAGRSLRQNF